MNISVVIPLLNERDSINELSKSIIEIMNVYNFSFEIIFIDDGSNDGSWEVLEKLSNEKNFIKGIKFQKNYGKSQALHAGFIKAEGNVVFTMDADLQDDPKEIPEMYNMIVNDNYELISGWKKKRFDSILTKNIPSKIFNFARTRRSPR